MKLPIYAICDSMTQFNDPFVALNDGAASRQFGQYAKHVDLVKDNPADFVLFKVGVFDNESGIIESELSPQHIISAMSFKEKE